jgi:hypothetical protein
MADATAATSRSRPRQIQTTSLFVTAQIARLYQGLPSETAVRIPNTDEWGDGLQNLVTPCLLFASILSIRRQAPSYERDNAHRR